MNETAIGMEVDEIENDISVALNRMYRLKRSDYPAKWIAKNNCNSENQGTWNDEDNCYGLIISCEALLSYLIPALRIESMRETILNDYSDWILESITEILDISEEKFSGSPYWDDTITLFENEETPNFVESFCYVLQTLLLSKELIESNKLKPQVERINSTIDRAIESINKCFMDHKDSRKVHSGWGWGDIDQKEPYLYGCWLVAETYSMLSDRKYNLYKLLPSLKSQNNYKTLGANTDKMKEWLEDRHIVNPDDIIHTEGEDGAKLDVTIDIVNFGDQDTMIYYNIWIIMQLVKLKSKKKDELISAIKYIYELYSKNDKNKNSYETKSETYAVYGKDIVIPEKDIKSTEKTYMPLVANLLISCKMSGYNDNSIDDFLSLILKSLLDNRLVDENFSGIWDRRISSGYSIYYTKRSIEALSLLHEYLTSLTISDGTLKLSIEIPNQQLNLLIDALISNDDFITKIAMNDKLVGKIKNSTKQIPNIKPSANQTVEYLKKTESRV